MGVSIIAAKVRAGSRWLIAACFIHASLITLLWTLRFQFNVSILPGKIWLGLALMWVLWIPIAVLVERRNLKAWLITGVAGLLMLMPTYSTIYAFTVWAIWGFAP